MHMMPFIMQLRRQGKVSKPEAIAAYVYLLGYSSSSERLLTSISSTGMSSCGEVDKQGSGRE